MEAIGAEALSQEEFAVSVPGHLPDSPLCPRHPSTSPEGRVLVQFTGYTRWFTGERRINRKLQLQS